MIKFIIQILIFSLGLLFANTVIFLYVNEVYYQEYSKVDTNEKYHTYILADSHGQPLEHKFLDVGIYNFAVESESYVDMLRKFRYLLNNSKVENIIIVAGDHTLSTYRDINNNNDRSVTFANSINDYSNIYEFLVYRYIKRFLPIVNGKSRDVFVQVFKSGFGKGNVEKNKKKWDSDYLWSDRTPENRAKWTSYRIEMHYGENVSYSSKQAEALREIIHLAKENNINLMGIKFPLSRDYLNLVGERSFGADRLLKEQGIKILDYKFLFQDQDENFYDQDHMNYIGVEKLKRQISKDLKKEKLIQE